MEDHKLFAGHNRIRFNQEAVMGSFLNIMQIKKLYSTIKNTAGVLGTFECRLIFFTEKYISSDNWIGIYYFK